MRVIAGSARSVKLVTPSGLETRPTTDRIKETLFNILQNDTPNSIFVDLFSGSGQIGIEALSRGAKKAYFIDNGKEPIDCIEANIAKTHLQDMSVVIKQDCINFITYGLREHPDVIFADPPYGRDFDRFILEGASKNSYIDSESLIVIEETKEHDFSYALELGFRIIKEKTYKTNKHVFLIKE